MISITAPISNMDTLFRSKNRTRTSGSSAAKEQRSSGVADDFTASVPYNQLPAGYPPPVAGPSTSSVSLVNGSRSRVSAPNTNPGLNGYHPPSTYDQRRSDGGPPIPTRRGHGRAASQISDSDVRDTGEGSIRRVPSNATEASGTRYQASSMSPDPTGLRYQPPSMTMGMGISPTDQSSSRPSHPYGTSSYRDSDTASIHTISSITSQMPNRDFGRYPSFSGASVTSRHSQSTPNGRPGPSSFAASMISLNLTPTISRVSEDFSFPRPPDGEVEARFRQLIENRDQDTSHAHVPSLSTRNSLTSASQKSIAETAFSLPIEKKWQMVESEARTRWEAARDTRRKEEEASRGSKGKKGNSMTLAKSSPEWYLKKCLDGTLTKQHLATLMVTLRTFPLE